MMLLSCNLFGAINLRKIISKNILRQPLLINNTFSIMLRKIITTYVDEQKRRVQMYYGSGTARLC